jgi:chorismate-pyruvate lyase
MTDKEPFDPLQSLWRVPTAHEANINHVNLRALSAFQRALLVTDGTVTKLIEIVTMEPVEVVLLQQAQHVLASEHPWLKTGPQTTVAVRQVLIQGKYSRTLYVHATSCLVPSRLPGEIQARLEHQGEGIGRLLNELHIETRREVLWYRTEHLTDLPTDIRGRSDGEFISRTYRIFSQGVPIALIHEKFPVLVGLPSMD